jgi:hypothetical protein
MQIDPDVARRLHDRRLDVVLVGVRAPDLEARRAGHAVAQRLHAPRADVDPVDVEEFDVRYRAAVDLVEDLVGFGALDLEAVVRAVDRLAVGAAVRARIVREAYLPLADGLLKPHPVCGRRAADEHELILALAEDDHVADDVTGGRDGHEVLRAVQVEVREAVDADVLEGCRGVRAFDDELVHVVRLIEQHRGLAPCDLLVAPVRELRSNDGIDVHADLRVAQ